MVKRTLYECSHARVSDGGIRCELGYLLSAKSDNGCLSVNRLSRGDRLALEVCQGCPDFDSLGPPVPDEEKGWDHSKKTVRNPYGRRGKPHEQAAGKAV